MKKGARVAVIIIVLIIAWVVVTNHSSQPSGQPITLGAVLSLTGAAAPQGEYVKQGMELAVEEINAAGGIRGRSVVLKIEDDHTAAKDAATAFTKLVSVDQVDGVIGGLWDFVAQPLIPLASSSRVAFISPTNFRIAGSFDLNSESFVMLSDLKTTVQALAPVLARSEVTTIGVLRFKSAFGEEIAKTIKDIAGGKKVLDESYVTIGGNDFRTVILKFKQAGVDAVFLDALDIDTLSFLTRARELDFHPLVMSHVLIMDALAKADVDKSLLEDVIVLNWEVSDPSLAQRFTTRFGRPPLKSADKSYEAVYVLANAIARSSSRDQVAGNLARGSWKTPVETITFTPDHTVSVVPVKLDQIKGGQLVPFLDR